MRQTAIRMLALALTIAACGTAVASQSRTVTLVEDRSYDRIEELRLGRLTVASAPDAGEFHRLARVEVPWSRN